MRQLIAYFTKHSVPGNLLMVLIVIFGIVGLLGLRKTFFPPAEPRFILVQAVYPGASPNEVEEGVIQKIETNLKGITDVYKITSIASENAGNITVEVIKGADIDAVLEDVKNAVDQISDFPEDLEQLQVFERENVEDALSFALSGDVPLTTLKSYAKRIEDDLLAQDGLSKIELSGFPDEEIEVAFREDDLRAYDLTFDQAAAAIRGKNVDLTGGTIKAADEELVIRARSKGKTAEELKDIRLKSTPDGRVVLLSDVADVRDQWADEPARDYMNGEPAVVITIRNTTSENLLDIREIVYDYIDDFNEQNDVVKATIFDDRSVNLQQRQDLLVKNGLIGFALVLIILALFLNIRLAFWVALSIPISFAGMFILASWMGVTINVISLFGMILVIGILVDDGIVIAENIYQHYERGATRFQAAVNGTLQVLPSVTSAVLTTMVGFVSFYFIDGRLGDIAPDIAFVVMATLLFSLIEGAFILPGHVAHSKAMKGKLKHSWLEKRTTGVMNWLKSKTYAPILRFSLTNRFFVFAVLVAFLMVTFGGFAGGIIRTTFFPSIESDYITVNVEMPAGTRDHITQLQLDSIEAAVHRVNERMSDRRSDNYKIVQNIKKSVGPGTHQGTMRVVLLDNETRGTKSFSIADTLRKEVGSIPGAEKLAFTIQSAFGTPISVTLLSKNEIELEKAKDELKERMSEISAIKDIVSNDQKGPREITITLKEKAHQLGLTLQSVIGQVRQGFFGFEVQRLQRGEDNVKVWVRYEESDRSSQAKLEDMRIRLPDGREYPFSEVADYKIQREVLVINHLNLKRAVRIDADVADPSQSAQDLMLEIQDSILPGLKEKYPSISVAYEGQFEEAQRSQKSIQGVMPFTLLLMFAMVVFTFRSWWQAAIVFMMIPFGMIGVGWGHWLHGVQFSLLSTFGLIALIGIMVNDSLVLLAAFNERLKEGMNFYDSLYEASLSRFRPILLTSVTTIAGLAPLILETSFQAQFLVPMAISVAYGLAIATVTTLILLPIFVIFLNYARRFFYWMANGGDFPSPETVEPAVKELKIDLEFND